MAVGWLAGLQAGIDCLNSCMLEQLHACIIQHGLILLAASRQAYGGTELGDLSHDDAGDFLSSYMQDSTGPDLLGTPRRVYGLL